ncbi:MAG: ABC transporter permease [Firmicutes bacterium]|nr:ABC transporter permease [Bacillota bacterium]
MDAKTPVADQLIGKQQRSMRLWMFVSRYGTLAAFLVMAIVLSFVAPGFLTMFNILTILRQISVLGIMGLGMTLVMAGGGIDLSIGEAADVGGLVCVALLAQGWGAGPAVLAGLAGGAAMGMLNATLIAGIGIAPFLATLGVHSMVRSLEMAFTRGGLPIYLNRAMPRPLIFLGRGLVGPIPTQVIVLAVLALAYYVIYHRVTLGRYVTAVGLNREAARLSGVSVNKVTATTYVLASATAALAGVILAARVSSGQPLAGGAYLLDTIAAVFMGRTISAEGRPNVLGTLVGAAFLGTVVNGMTLLNVVFYMQTFIKGALLLGVLALASFARTKRG